MKRDLRLSTASDKQSCRFFDNDLDLTFTSSLDYKTKIKRELI